MAGDSVVGALRVVLGMDTAQFEDGAKKAAGAAQSFGTSISRIASGIALAKIVESVTQALVSFTKQVVEAGNELNKLSIRSGIPVESLSSFKLAADQAGVSVDQFANAMTSLQVQISKTNTQEITPLISAFNFLRINLESFRKLSPEDQFLTLADAISQVRDKASQVGVSAAILEKELGGKLLPLLIQGRKGFEDIRNTVEALGLKMATETSKSATELSKRMQELGSVASGIALQALKPVIDRLKDMATGTVNWIKESGFVFKAADALTRSFQLVADNIYLVNAALATFIARLAVGAVFSFVAAMARAVSTMAQFIVALVTLNTTALITVARIGTIAAVFLYFTGNLSDFTEKLGKLGETFKSFIPDNFSAQITAGLKFIGVDISAITGETNKMAEGAKKARIEITPLAENVRKWDPEADKRLARFNEELLKLGLQSREVSGEFAGRLAPGFIQAAMSLELIKKNGEGLNAVLGLTTKQSRDLNDALARVEAQRLTQEFLTPWQQYEDQLRRISLLQQKGELDSRTRALAEQKAALTMTAAYGQAAVTITTGFADAFKSIAEKNKQYAGIAKAAAIAQALAQTFVAANTAMAQTAFGGLPLQLAAAAAVTAAGLANVAKIASTDFATGGSFKVGGAGGIDSQLVAFNATPGEMVDVRKPGTAGPTAEITLQGIGPRDFYSGEMVRGLVDSLNKAYADGYRIRVAS